MTRGTDPSPLSAGNAPADVRAQKRQAIGLAPHRPTARAAVQHPPGLRRAGADTPGSCFVAGLVGVALATALLVAAMALGSPTSWKAVRAEWQRWAQEVEAPGSAAATSATSATSATPAVEAAAGAGPAMLYLATEFDGSPVLAEQDASGRFVTGQVADAGVYRMRIWPGNLAWSLPLRTCFGPYRLEAEGGLAAETPDGYAGLVGRFVDERNFYLFALDGTGRARVLLQKAGEWRVLQDWAQTPGAGPAGSPNRLALEDDGLALAFAVNGVELFRSDDLALPAGAAGLAAGAGAAVAQVDFDRLRLDSLDCAHP